MKFFLLTFCLIGLAICGEPQIKLYTNEQRETPYFLDESNLNQINSSYYCTQNADKCMSYMIIHGFLSSSEADWVINIKDELFKRDKLINVFTIDWRNYADNPEYFMVVGNIRKVYPTINNVFQLLVKMNYLKIANQNQLNLHCIGHSLGAHICGFFAKAFAIQQEGARLKRITGMDPAGPCFLNNNEQNRLDKADAFYVDIIHTNTKLFGIAKSIGHTDFYPNGGASQPGCIMGPEIIPDDEVFKCAKINVTSFGTQLGSLSPSCSHSRSHDYFLESINSQNCTYNATKCSNWKSFSENKCSSCPRNVMGFDSVQTDVMTDFYLNVRSEAPFCQVETLRNKRNAFRRLISNDVCN